MNRGESYRHGGRPRLDLERFGIPDRALTDFSVSLNPLGPPRIIGERWASMMDGIRNYPGLEGEGIALFYRERFGISPENVLGCNGSTEAIYLLPRALGIRKALVVVPSYHDYHRASRLAGAEVLSYPLVPEQGAFSYCRERILEGMHRADALWVGNPNNPTGTLFPKPFILELAGRFPDKWIVVDEAFIQFLEGWQDHSLLFEQPRPNLLVIHSLTKFYALAGLRLGGVVGAPGVISRLRMAKEPWSVNGLAERIAPLLIDCGGYERETLSLIRRERQRVFEALDPLKEIVLYPSTANFVLGQWRGTRNLDDLLRHLLRLGISLRDCRNFSGLQDNFFRFAILSPGENNTLVAGLKAFPEHS
ncbi:MAG: threonine-phosphate decarboxylase [Deltaproteobacteria bacterium]|nr:threonine-phosphate decarboxylase [Deltaproteobacteria bacterium]